VSQATAADADTLDRQRYRERLDSVRATLASARAATPPGRQPIVDRARALLRQTTALRLDDGTTLPIDDAALAERITTADGALDRALADVTALQAWTGRTPAIDPSAAEARLRVRVGEQRARDAQVSLIDVISRWFARFLADLRGAPPDPRIGIVVVGGLGLALLLVILGIMGRDLRERFRREVVLPELRGEAGPDPAVHLRQAEEALRAGRMRDAVHALYLYAIAALALREAIRYDPSLTDRELLARAATIPHVDALRDLVSMHERVWYGLRDASADDAARARALATRAAA
jgi:hypothetical protein